MSTHHSSSTSSPCGLAKAFPRAVVREPWCFLSGTTGYDHATSSISSDVAEQTRQILRTVTGVLEANGFELADVARVTCVVAEREHWPAVYQVLGETFRDIRPVLQTCVASLIEPAMKVELQITALRRAHAAAASRSDVDRRAEEPESSEAPEERIRRLGFELPAIPKPVANYVPYRISGNWLFVSGQVPRSPGGDKSTGRVGRQVTVEQAYSDACNVGLQLLAVAKSALGELDRVTSVVKLLGMVNADPDFVDHPKVVNGCSDLFVEVFGPRGKHARSAVGMGSLPSGVTIEIEAIFEFS
jgi:enamine deaminase RidA (YjgF/YER057c/UK114 family)